MKRKVLTVCLVLALVLTAVCCSSCKDNSEKLVDQLRTVNTLLRVKYSKMELNVTTQYSEVTLNAKYVLTKNDASTNIEYEVDRLNSIDVNDGSITMPDGLTSRVTGKAVFNGSAVETIDGVEVNPQVLFDIADLSIMFRVKDLANVMLMENAIEATVINPKSFMNRDSFDGTEMTAKVEYNETTITSMIINYKAADGANVELSYAFTR